MGTFYIDPPWPTENALLPYLPMDLDELRNLPVPMLAAERCHLHMWATANRFLFEAKNIIENWGFRVVGNFVVQAGDRTRTLLASISRNSAQRRAEQQQIRCSWSGSIR